MRKSVLRRLQVILGAFAILTVVAPSPAQAQIRRVSSSDDWRQAIGFKPTRTLDQILTELIQVARAT